MSMTWADRERAKLLDTLKADIEDLHERLLDEKLEQLGSGISGTDIDHVVEDLQRMLDKIASAR